MDISKVISYLISADYLNIIKSVRVIPLVKENKEYLSLKEIEVMREVIFYKVYMPESKFFEKENAIYLKNELVPC